MMRCKKKPASIVRKIKHFLSALRRVWTAVITNVTPLTSDLFSCNILSHYEME